MKAIQTIREFVWRRLRSHLVCGVSLSLLLAHPAIGQTTSVTAPTVAVSPAASALPRLVRFNGTVKDLGVASATGVVGITFALYAEPSGGAPLWVETQNVQADVNRRYTVLLGSTKAEGLPAELFTSEQAHWVGVQVSGQAEQQRVLLVSAPYALKAGDAETLGGFPASAFMLAAPATGVMTTGATAAPESSPPVANNVTGSGTAGYLPQRRMQGTLREPEDANVIRSA